jgi:hypothetical protein
LVVVLPSLADLVVLVVVLREIVTEYKRQQQQELPIKVLLVE